LVFVREKLAAVRQAYCLSARRRPGESGINVRTKRFANLTNRSRPSAFALLHGRLQLALKVKK